MDRSETDCPRVIREDRIREIHAEHFSRGSPTFNHGPRYARSICNCVYCRGRPMCLPRIGLAHHRRGRYIGLPLHLFAMRYKLEGEYGANGNGETYGIPFRGFPYVPRSRLLRILL